MVWSVTGPYKKYLNNDNKLFWYFNGLLLTFNFSARDVTNSLTPSPSKDGTSAKGDHLIKKILLDAENVIKFNWN